MKQIKGIGPDTPVEENEFGGKQSKLPYRFDLIDVPAIFSLAERLAYGAKRYEDNNWRKISARDHFNHLLAHIYAYLGDDKQDNHLGAIMARAMMAVAIALKEEQVDSLKQRILKGMVIRE